VEVNSPLCTLATLCWEESYHYLHKDPREILGIRAKSEIPCPCWESNGSSSGWDFRFSH